MDACHCLWVTSVVFIKYARVNLTRCRISSSLRPFSLSGLPIKNEPGSMHTNPSGNVIGSGQCVVLGVGDGAGLGAGCTVMGNAGSLVDPLSRQDRDNNPAVAIRLIARLISSPLSASVLYCPIQGLSISISVAGKPRYDPVYYQGSQTLWRYGNIQSTMVNSGPMHGNDYRW